MTTDKILHEISQLGDRLSVHLMFGKEYYSEKEWDISLRYDKDQTRVETRGRGPNFDEALKEAWERLNQVVLDGISHTAMTPKVLAAPKDAEWEEVK